MHDLRVTLVQSTLHWEQKASNIKMFEALLEGLEHKTDLIVLPEMFSTGFSMSAPQLAEPMDGPTVQWLQRQAKRCNATITGSIIIQENGSYFNRLIWMQPDGTSQSYDKRHLFTLGEEHKHYTAGTEKLIVEYKGWKICPLICYDLRFPVWSRNIESYDLLLYVANWPEIRSMAWKHLLIARAIENQSYTIGVNRIGKDANEVYHSGDSMLVDYAGKVITLTSDCEAVVSTSISLEKQEKFRSKLQFLRDRDSFQIGTGKEQGSALWAKPTSE